MNFLKKLFAFNKKEASGYDAGGWSPYTINGVNTGNTLQNNTNWVFVAVDRIANTMSGIRFKIMKWDQNVDVEVFDTPLNKFIEKPSKYLSFKDLIYLSQAHKELTGNAFWKWDKSDKVIDLLIPTRVMPIINNGQFIGYKYQNGTKVETISFNDLKHDKYPDPLKPYWGRGPLEAIAGWVDTDRYASEFNRLFFEKGASFGGFIETDEESRDRIELIKTGLVNNHTGLNNFHKIAVLPKNSKFAPATASMTDMQFAELDDRYRDKILSGFGVPKTLAGLVTEVNRASAEASEYIFARYTIKPKVDRFVEFFNNEIIPLLDKSGKYYLSYDEFVPENIEAKVREREIALNRQPYKTVNEVRAEDGLPPITGGNVIYGQPFAMPIGEPIEEKRAEYVEKGIDAAVENLAKKVIEVMKPSQREIDIADHKEFVARTEQYIPKIAEKIVQFNSAQKKDIINRINNITKSQKAVKKDDFFDIDTEVGIMVDMVSPILGLIMTEQALREYQAQNFEGQFDVNRETIKKAVEKAAKRMAKSYNDTTANLLKQALNEGIREGLGLRELTEKVAQVYEFSDKYRALAVAHTESFYVANEGSKEAYKQSGVVKTIRWFTAEDEMVCEFCGPQNGKEVGVEEDFFDRDQIVSGRDGGRLDTSYRAIDVPPLHPNCRCFIKPAEISIKEAPKAQEKVVEQKKENKDIVDRLIDVLENE